MPYLQKVDENKIAWKGMAYLDKSFGQFHFFKKFFIVFRSPCFCFIFIVGIAMPDAFPGIQKNKSYKAVPFELFYMF